MTHTGEDHQQSSIMHMVIECHDFNSYNRMFLRRTQL